MNNNLLKILLGVFFAAFYSVSLSAYEYRVENIADSLKKNAISVVRSSSVVYSQSDENNATMRVSEIITVLNSKGDYYGNFRFYGDNFRELKGFNGIVRNNAGKEIRKIKKGDLTESNLSEQMASDAFVSYYTLTSPVYPYTVEYNYEMRFKNGIIAYPSFLPMNGTGQSVEKADFTFEIPTGFKIRVKSHFDCEIKEEEIGGKHYYKLSASNLVAMANEPIRAPIMEVLPKVSFYPVDFCYDKVCGTFDTWKEYGKWVNVLLNDRDRLPVDVVNQLKDLTKNAISDRDKVVILYKHLQENSRYVSIQLGIGGFQPIPAETTYRAKYGDCKGLSNLMRAFLRAVGISSNYCEIYTENNTRDGKHLYKDYPNVSQTNHAILLVPLKNDSIWLECTSQTLPMGFVHDGIAGHDALVMTDEGGVLCRLPSYTSAENKTTSIISMNIAANGKIEGKMSFSETAFRYGDYSNLMKSNDRERHVKYITGSINLARLSIGEIRTSEDITEMPACTMQADYVAEDFVNITGQRMFIPISPLKKSGYSVFKSNTRENDIVIDVGFSESDSITINIPEGYAIESMPKPRISSTPFGTFFTIVKKLDENTLLYTQEITVLAGKHDKKHYEDIRKIFRLIASASNDKLVVRKAE